MDPTPWLSFDQFSCTDACALERVRLSAPLDVGDGFVQKVAIDVRKHVMVKLSGGLLLK